MGDEPLLEEHYAPDTYRVLVTCIFLNKTRAIKARPYLEDFFEEYPTPDLLQHADPGHIREEYFVHLGLYRRAGWLVEMAGQLLRTPPRPNERKRKSHKDAGYASEVSHLAGVGDYASDAWRLFCKKQFYATHGIIIEDEWRALKPKDKDLRRYVERKKREEWTAMLEEEITAGMAKVRLSTTSTSRPTSTKSDVLLGSGYHALRVPQRLIDDANVNSTASTRRLNRVVASAS